MHYLSLFFATILLLLTTACNESVPPLPKPRIYPKVLYPEKAYIPFAAPECPFTMEIPTYFQYIKDSKQTKEEAQHQCWFDLYYKDFNSYLHLSYLDINSTAQFEKLVADAFEMADKHNVKASYRQELLIDNPEQDVYGLIFEIDGPVATPMQFFVSDSTQHFLRGSLYFKSETNRDSIAPIYDFLKKDIAKLIETFEWN